MLICLRQVVQKHVSKYVQKLDKNRPLFLLHLLVSLYRALWNFSTGEVLVTLTKAPLELDDHGKETLE